MAKRTTKKRQQDQDPKVEIIKRSISDFLKDEYFDYVIYALENRALPSLVDGLKVGARKILHAAFNGGAKSGKEIKNLNLVGDVYNLTLYSHGDASLHGTILTLAQDFKDNLNPLYINGQYGSLRDQNAVSAPRYLHVALSKYSHIYQTDKDLLQYVYDEGQNLEPINYLPIIPTVLTSRTTGMAPGYSFLSFSYNPLQIIDACLDVLMTGESQRIVKPWIRGIKSYNIDFDKTIDRWINYGEFDVDVKRDIIYINDLPFDIEFDAYEQHLNKMKDDGFIKKWTSNSNGDKISYWVYFNKGRVAKLTEPERLEILIKRLKLSSVIPKNNLTVLDEKRKIRYFDTPESLIEYFVKFRLSIYEARKTNLIDILSDKLIKNDYLIKFIDLVIAGKIKVIKRPKVEVIKDLDKFELPHTVLQLPISKLTKEERDEIVAKSKEIKSELKYIKTTTTSDMYIYDLINLHEKLKTEF